MIFFSFTSTLYVFSLFFFQGKPQPPPTPTGLGPSSSAESLMASSNSSSGGVAGNPQGGGESAPIRAPMSLWRCSRIMHLLRDLHPTLLSALEGIVDQVSYLDYVAIYTVYRQMVLCLYGIILGE